MFSQHNMADQTDDRAIVFRLSKHARSRRGCQTCRSRKVKCDEEHPQCRACVRAKRECIWTRPCWKFRDQNTMLAQAYTVIGSRPQEASKVANRSSNGISNTITISLDDGRRNACFENTKSGNLDDHVVLPCWSSSRTLPSRWDYSQVELLYSRGFRMRPLVDTADFQRNQALVTALSHYLPLDESSLQSDKLENRSKMSFLSPHNSSLFNPRVPALAAAVDALSLTQAAVRLQDGLLAQQAMKSYTISIALLRRSIEQIGNYDRNEVLLTIMLLQIAEVSPVFRPKG